MSATARRRPKETAVVSELSSSQSNDHDESPQNQNLGRYISINHGGHGHQFVAHCVSHINYPSDSLFNSMVNTHPGIYTFESEPTSYERRAKFLNDRVTDNSVNSELLPAAKVRNNKLKESLRLITERFLYLDSGFAEYFEVVAKSFGERRIKRMLNDARLSLSRRQPARPERSAVFLGDLGHHCEEISQWWANTNNEAKPTLSLWHENDQQKFSYLQYAFEVPYWQLMLRLFVERHRSPADMTRISIFRILESIKVDVLAEKVCLLKTLEAMRGEEKEDISPIITGIDARIEALEGIQGSLNAHRLLEPPKETPETDSSDEFAQGCIQSTPDYHSQCNEAAMLISLVFIFLSGAIIPGYKAFSIAIEGGKKPGTTEDSDFWNLVQNNIMAVMASVITIFPHLLRSWSSPVYTLMWFFFFCGLVFTFLAIGLYLVCNPAWSSVVSFLGSIASTASMIVFTQVTAREHRWGRQKNESSAGKEKKE